MTKKSKKFQFTLNKYRKWLLISSLLLLSVHYLEGQSLSADTSNSSSQDPSEKKAKLENYWKKYVVPSGGDLTGLEFADLVGVEDATRGPRIFVTFTYNPPKKGKVNEFSYRFDWRGEYDQPLGGEDAPFIPLMIQPGERKRVQGVFSNKVKNWKIEIKQTNK